MWRNRRVVLVGVAAVLLVVYFYARSSAAPVLWAGGGEGGRGVPGGPPAVGGAASEARLYRTRAEFCVVVDNPVVSPANTYARVPIPGLNGLPAWWFVPAVPDILLHLTKSGEAFKARVWGVDFDDGGGLFSEIMRLVPPTAIMIDVGANIGWSSLRVAANGRRVIALEPGHDMCLSIASSVCMNRFEDRYTLVEAAVGAANGRAQFFGAGDGATMLADVWAERAHVAAPEGHEVPVVSLDALLSETPFDWGAVVTNVALLKFDVQGYEIHVMRGAARLLREARRGTWVCSEHDYRMIAKLQDPAGPIADLEFMVAQGYSVHTTWREPEWPAAEWRSAAFNWGAINDVWFMKL